MQPGISVTPGIRLVKRLGEGGMGSVWLAEHLSLRTHVVVKFMAVELAANAEAVERFSREAAAAAQVKSPHVVQMLDHGVTPDGVAFIVMELLEGQDLRKHIAARGRLSLHETADIIGQVCKALARAHERGIVHRDIKPDNIFLCSGSEGDVFVKLLDFGIAKSDSRLGGSSGTKTGAMIGTPYYMSPEQIVGSKGLDWRTDLWSLGIVGYECVVGVKPFDEEIFGALAIRIHSGPMPVPSVVDPQLPPAFDAWFARACARDIAMRFASAKELADGLFAVAASLGPAASAAPVASPAAYTAGPQATPSQAPSVAHTPHFSGSTGLAAAYPAAPHGGTNGGLGGTLSPRSSKSGGSAALIIAVSIGLAVLAIGGAVVVKVLGASASASRAAASVASPAPIVPVATSAPRTETTVLVPLPPASSAAVSAPPVSSSPPPAAPSKPRPQAAAPAAPKTATSPPANTETGAANCNPPFFFDAKGNRVFKPECL